MAVSFLTHEETEREEHLLEYLETVLRELRPAPKAESLSG